MDGVAAFADQLGEFGESNLGPVPILQRAASDVPTSRDREYQRSEARRELLVEGAN